MNILNLLAASDGITDAVSEASTSAFNTFKSVINIIFPIFIGVILIVALFYGVQLGIKYAKAEEEEDKKKAKSSLINVIVGCLIAIIFVAVIEIILNQGFVGKLFGDVTDKVSLGV